MRIPFAELIFQSLVGCLYFTTKNGKRQLTTNPTKHTNEAVGSISTFIAAPLGSCIVCIRMLQFYTTVMTTLPFLCPFST